jgi:hypothetical protein
MKLMLVSMLLANAAAYALLAGFLAKAHPPYSTVRTSCYFLSVPVAGRPLVGWPAENRITAAFFADVLNLIFVSPTRADRGDRGGAAGALMTMFVQLHKL